MRARVGELFDPVDADRRPPARSAGLHRRDAELVHRPMSSLAFEGQRGYETNQLNTSGTVDLSLSNSSFLSFRGGYFHDRYSDTGIPLTTTLHVSDADDPVRRACCRLSLRGGIGTANLRRAQITEFDTTKRSTLQHRLQPRVQRRRAPHAEGRATGSSARRTTSTRSTRAGTCSSSGTARFAFGGQNLGRGTYGYYEVNDRRITNQAGSNIHSLYVQDQWTVNNRLTLNLGLRTENEEVPTFRPDVLKNAFEFGFADKLAPRLGAAYDVWGDGRMKLFGSWGLYYDWTKYELPRGSFGAETWCIYYRGLDTLDLGSLSLSNMPGRDLWVNQGGCRDRRVPSFRRRNRSRSRADAAGQHQRRRRVPARQQQRADGPLHPQRSARDDRGRGLPERGGRRGIPDQQPRQAPGGHSVPDRRDGARPGDSAPEARLRRAGARLQPAVLEQLVPQRQLHAEPPVRQLLRARVVRRDHHADDRRRLVDGAAAGGQHCASGRQRESRVGPRRAAV